MFLVNISPRGIGGFSEEGMEGQLGFSIICGFSGNNSSSNRCNACIQRMPAEPFKSNLGRHLKSIVKTVSNSLLIAFTYQIASFLAQNADYFHED